MLIDLVKPRIAVLSPALAAWLVNGADLDMWPQIEILNKHIPWLISAMATEAPRPPVALHVAPNGDWRIDFAREDGVSYRHASIVPHGHPSDMDLAVVRSMVNDLHRAWPHLILSITETKL